MVAGCVAVLIFIWAALAIRAAQRAGSLAEATPFLLTGSALAALAVGSLAVVLAAVLMARSPATGAAVLPRPAPAVLAMAVTVTMALAGCLVVAQTVRDDATTADRVEPAPVPAQPSKVAWRWRPDDGEVHTVVRAGAGVVVETGTRIVALDGRTGKERWHYRNRAAVSILELRATPDGRTVLAEFDLYHPDGRRYQRVVLDAMTGHVRHKGDTRPSLNLALLGNGTVVDRLERPLTGYSFRGSSRWRLSPPTGCSVDKTDVEVVDGTLLFAAYCLSDRDHGREWLSATIFGVEVETGTQRWRRNFLLPASTLIPRRISPDGRPDLEGYAEFQISGDPRFVAVEFIPPIPGDNRRSTPIQLLFDTRTGEVLRHLPPAVQPVGAIQIDAPVITYPKRDQYFTIDPASGDLQPLPLSLYGIEKGLSDDPREPSRVASGEACLVHVDESEDDSTVQTVRVFLGPDYRRANTIAVEAGPSYLLAAPGAFVMYSTDDDDYPVVVGLT